MRSTLLLTAALAPVYLAAHNHAHDHGGRRGLEFHENKGQWPEHVLYRALIPGGAMFVERSAFTYVLYSNSPLRHHGHAHDGHDRSDEGKAHAYRVHFEGGAARMHYGSGSRSHYENFFIGDDEHSWGTGCAVFEEVNLDEVWPGIDLRISGKEGIKYDFIVAPGFDPSAIKLRYEGHDELMIDRGQVRVKLSTGTVTEGVPETWKEQLTSADCDGGKLNLTYAAPEAHPCAYRLNGDLLTFTVEQAKGARLTIDPLLTFGSYSGSTADNFGFTATYDHDGHLYGAGIVFNTGYPLTLGVLQDFFSGGNIDVGISKWSTDGSSLEWSTYLGGNGSESPHSLVVNDQDELYVLGATGSSDFPTTCLLYTSPSPRDGLLSRMPSSA